MLRPQLIIREGSRPLEPGQLTMPLTAPIAIEPALTGQPARVGTPSG
jgi:hypothetical protein